MSFLEDLRFAFRSLTKARGLAVSLIAILGLGIGGTTAMFSVVYGVLLKPLPLHEPDRLVRIGGSVTAAPGERDRLRFWSQAKSFEVLAEIVQRGGVNLGAGDTPLYVPTAAVSASFFDALREKPHLGRTFRAEEEVSGRNRVVILSDGLWKEAFGGDPRIVGKEIRLSGHLHTVIGVLRAGFTFPDETQMWIPRSAGSYEPILGELDQSQLRYMNSLSVFGRLKSGATLEEAQAEVRVLDAEMKRLQRDVKLGADGGGAFVIPLQQSIVRGQGPVLYTLLAGVSFLLLIACANASNLILIRSAARQKEIAVRVALGAGRTRIFRLLLAEGVLVALASSVVGAFLATWVVNLIHLFGPASVPRLSELRIDAGVLGFSVLFALLICILLTLVTAAQISSMRLTTVLKEEAGRSAGRVGKQARNALVVAEVALSVVLLAGAGLMMRTLHQLMSIEPGFSPQSVVTMHLSLPAARYVSHDARSFTLASSSSAEQIPIDRAHRQILAAIAELPGVVSTGSIHHLPLADRGGGLWIHRPQVPHGPIATASHVARDYFQTMRIPLLAGRYFDQSDFDRPGETIIISRSLAERFWVKGSPIGEQLRVATWSEKNPRVIIGVVENAVADGLGENPFRHPQFYLPSEAMNEFTLVVRGMGCAEELSRAVRTAIRSFDRGLAVSRVQTLSEVVYKAVAPQRFRGQLLGAFAGTALVLALFGVAAVMGYSVANRTHEIGVRMALGAMRGDVLRMVLREGLRLSLVGVLLGLLGAWWLSRYVASLLYGVSATDPWTYAGAAVILVAGGLLGSLAPALRASRVDPAAALRYE